MKHLSAINKKAARVVAATAPDVVALQQGGAPQQPERRTSRPDARSCSRRAGRPITPAAPPGCARRSSATSSTATWAASGRPTCPISSTTPPTGPPSARWPRRTGARSTWCSRDEAPHASPAGWSGRGRRRRRCDARRVGPDRRATGPPLAAPSRGPMATGGNGTMYIGTYKGEIEIYDEATEKMVDKIVLKTGIPRSLTPSPDRTRFYALDSRFEQIEVIDIATRKTHRQLQADASATSTMRVTNLQPDPGNKFLIAALPHGHQAGRPLGDRAADHPAVRPDHAPVHPHHPVAEGRRARDGEHAARPRRQAPVHLRRRRHGARDRQLHRGGVVAVRAAEPRPASAASTSARRTTSTTRPGRSPACSRCRTRCRSAG